MPYRHVLSKAVSFLFSNVGHTCTKDMIKNKLLLAKAPALCCHPAFKSASSFPILLPQAAMKKTVIQLLLSFAIIKNSLFSKSQR
jgi:hypothetical protein